MENEGRRTRQVYRPLYQTLFNLHAPTFTQLSLPSFLPKSTYRINPPDSIYQIEQRAGGCPTTIRPFCRPTRSLAHLAYRVRMLQDLVESLLSFDGPTLTHMPSHQNQEDNCNGRRHCSMLQRRCICHIHCYGTEDPAYPCAHLQLLASNLIRCEHDTGDLYPIPY